MNLTHRPPLADVALEATIATKQDPEKATPLFATNLLDRLSVSVSGDGGHIRDLEDWWRLLTEAGASERLDV